MHSIKTKITVVAASAIVVTMIIPEEDEPVNDVVRRADKLMYENKWNVKGKVRGE